MRLHSLENYILSCTDAHGFPSLLWYYLRLTVTRVLTILRSSPLPHLLSHVSSRYTSPEVGSHVATTARGPPSLHRRGVDEESCGLRTCCGPHSPDASTLERWGGVRGRLSRATKKRFASCTALSKERGKCTVGLCPTLGIGISSSTQRKQCSSGTGELVWSTSPKYLSGDDKKGSEGSDYRRAHHHLTVTYEALMTVVIERFYAAHPEHPTASNRHGARYPTLDQEAWRVNTRRSVFGRIFCLKTIPRISPSGSRCARENFKLRLAALRRIAPIFCGYGKDRYQWLVSVHLADMTWMTKDDMASVSCLFTTSLGGDAFALVGLDEKQEVANRTLQRGRHEDHPRVCAQVSCYRFSERGGPHLCT